MTYYPDLTPYVYWPEVVYGAQPYPDGVEILNVGWLGAGHDFPTFDGDPDPEFLPNLLGSAEIHVVTPDGRWLAAPTMVVHYVRDHGYRPPNEFVEAVKAMRVAPRLHD